MGILRRLSVALLLAAFAAPSSPMAEPATLSVGEVRQISTVRETRAAGEAAPALAAARAYLAKYPEGRYADEALLALAEALAALKQHAQALAAYDKLTRQFPESPLRDQAIVQSLPILRAEGQTEEALSRADRLAAGGPASMHAGQARLWKARTLVAERRYDEAVAVLSASGATNGLSEEERTAHLRTLALALWYGGDKAKARPAIERYLAREDGAEAKASVLLIAAADARERGRSQEALDDYRQIIEQYPAPAALAEARFRRAEVYAQTAIGDTSDDAGRARLQQAIAFYGDSVDGADARFRAPALLGRATLLLRAGRPADALSDLDGAARLAGAHQGDPEGVRTRVALLRQLGRDDEAAAVLAAALGNAALPLPARAEFTLELAEVHYGRKDCASVEAALRPLPLLAGAGRRHRALFLRGFCALRRERWVAAAADLEPLAHDPATLELAVPALLDAYEKTGQQARLVLLVEDLLGGGRIAASPDLMARLALAYEALGEPERILDVYRRLAKADPQAALLPGARVRQGRAEEALGHSAAAVAHFEGVLAEPQSAEADPDAYLTALERIQFHYRRAGRYADLAALNEAAAKAALPPAGQAKVRAALLETHLDWGHVLLSQGNLREAGAQFEGARARSTPADGPKRIEILLALAAVTARQEQPEKGLRLFREEFAKAPTGEYRAALVTAVLANHPDWAETLIKEKDRDAAARFHEQQLKALPKERFADRQAAALKLDALYKAGGKFPERAAVYAALAEGVEEGSRRQEINSRLSDVHREWGEAESKRKRPDAALKQFAQARALASAADWRRQYPLAVAMGQVYAARKEYTELVLAYEDVLPRIPDERLRAALSGYLGQVYLDWGRLADAQGNLKSARVRYWRALDYLPPASGAERAGAAIALAAVLTRSGDPAAAAAMLADVVKQVPPGRPRQEALLALGRARHEAKEDAAARPARAEVDTGGKDEASLEAGLLLAELDANAKRPDAAVARLEKLLERKPEETSLDVLIHYRLAVLRHQQGALKGALEHYRAVAAARSPAREQYAAAVAQAREQADALGRYLRSSGGETGARIAVPKVGAQD
jgi:tetratricopeptide (TPR) repeat protein